ncbi:hypothetical protein IEO21_00578 [Rhodonia placenta]|uniref:Fe2OG dioxygenase domain-containing protein n=1 Tax=Rhodonia placenta TaxID=104341 RepID=A0A8H7U719_9APHY|nr:hypothetical protein IEO21_00578 [Postia placenta]
MTLLRPPNSKEAIKQPPRFPPLTLATPALVAQHTPCTLHPSILPPALACRIFYHMMNESQNWRRNRWWLFDRVVESPHRTSFFVRSHSARDGDAEHDMHEAAKYWYNGRETEPPATFPPDMEEACKLIERAVNAEMRKRKRLPLEWAGEPPQDGDEPGENIMWRANVAASNCYEGAKESVGPHSDQLTYLGPYPTIASLSLGTSRVFRLREVIPSDEKDERNARTYNIPLAHNSLLIMHASTQEMFKHSIPPQSTIDMFHPPFPPSNTDNQGVETVSSNARINITFRFYRPDYRAEKTPRCKCGVPCILRPDMKNRYSAPAASPGVTDNAFGKDLVAKYWWTCYAGAQNDGKGCGMWKVMDVVGEGRGPFVGAVPKSE